MSGRARTEAPVEPVNEVVLVGRVAAPATEKALPSGDELVVWRLVVDRRPAESPPGGRAVTIDTVDCVAWRPTVRRAAALWSTGDIVRVEGSLRRRFWRSPTGPASRYEVEARAVKRLAKA